jgi:hypothetical protein
MGYHFLWGETPMEGIAPSMYGRGIDGAMPSNFANVLEAATNRVRFTFPLRAGCRGRGP